MALIPYQILYLTLCKLESIYPEAAFIVAGDFNKANLKTTTNNQGQQPPEPLPVHPAIIQKARSVQVHQSWDRETEKQLLSQGHQTVKQPPLTLSGCCQHTDSTPATLLMGIDGK